MRKSDLINQISEKTGIPKVDVLVTLETMFKEVKESLSNGQNIYIRVLAVSLPRSVRLRSDATSKRIQRLKFLSIMYRLSSLRKNL